MSRAGRLVAIVVAALALAAPATARAEAVSGAELTALAEQAAAGDASAAERLRGVDEVDGRPVAVREALSGAEGDEIAQRARLIAASIGARPGGSPAADRRAAQEVLDDAPLQRRRGAPTAGRADRMARRSHPAGDRLVSTTSAPASRAARSPCGWRSRPSCCCWPAG